MRKLKLQVQMSLDGFVAGPKNDMDWLVTDWDNALKKYVQKITQPVDCIIMGSKLAREFIPHWTDAYNNPAGAEEGSEKMVETPKVVFSKTLKETKWENTVLAKGNLEKEIKKLKRTKGKDIIVYGGARFVSSLIKHNLIDEYYLLMDPTAIGKGLPVFKKLKQQLDLSLIETRSFSCGITVLKYSSKK